MCPFPSRGMPISCHSPTNINVSATLDYPVVDHGGVLADEILHIHLVFAVARGREAHTCPGGLGFVPVRSKVQVFGAGAEAKVQCGVWCQLYYSVAVGSTLYSPFAAPRRVRASRKARMGATPVPGPTRITGTSSAGRWSVGGSTVYGIRVPGDQRWPRTRSPSGSVTSHDEHSPTRGIFRLVR